MTNTLQLPLNKPQTSVQEKIYTNGSHYFDDLISDLSTAYNAITIETYIFNQDALGERIIAALCDAGQRGVHVRIIVDGAGSPKFIRCYARRLEQCGVKVRIFHPFPWQIRNLSRSLVRLPWLIKLIYLLWKVNSRNHRKVCIIDDHIAYIGSINISKSHLHEHQGGDGWRDTAVRIHQYPLDSLIEAFNVAWDHQSIKERVRDLFESFKKEPRFRLNYTRHRRRILHKKLLKKIQGCKHRIWITNAYFVPDTILLRRLKEAASRGMDVRILLPQHSDVVMMPWASSAFYANCLEAGIRIYEYQPNILHAKTLIIDQWALIGSSNLNHRSILHDLEADVQLECEHAKNQLRELFLRDLQCAREMTRDDHYRARPLWQRIIGRVVLYIKYWI